MIDDTLLHTWAERLRAVHPSVLAILAHGSYARGEQQRHSDLDLDMLFEHAPAIGYRSVIDTLPNGNLLHATIAGWALAEWLEQFEQPQESEEWAFFLPARQVALLLWATPEVHAQLAERTTLELKASPQLQDMIESACKVRRTYQQEDELGMRLAAQNMALRCPAVVGLLNPPVRVNTNAEALRAALAMPHVPPYYREDLLVCLGLSASATSLADLYMRTLRLATGIVSFLQPHAAEIAEWLEPDIPLYLADGRLLRLLTDP